jgi:hypothetical protein
MTQSQPLLRLEEEFRPLLLVAGLDSIADAQSSWMDAGLVVRIIRGRKTRNRSTLFDEFSAAFQFPLYFGENEDAFDECLADLEGVPRGAGFVILITEPEQVLADASSETMVWLVNSLRGAAREWSEPIALGESWDRPAVPFHVVLACAPETVGEATLRWAAAGADLAPLAG